MFIKILIIQQTILAINHIISINKDAEIKKPIKIIKIIKIFFDFTKNYYFFLIKISIHKIAFGIDKEENTNQIILAFPIIDNKIFHFLLFNILFK